MLLIFKKWFWHLLLLWLLLSVISVINLRYRPGLPLPIQPEPVSGKLTIALRKSKFLHIRAVDNIPTQDPRIIEMIVDKKRIGDMITVRTVEKGRIQLRLVHRYAAGDIILNWFIGLIFLFIGVWVKKQQEGEPALYFISTVFLFGLIIAMSWLGIGHPFWGWPVLIVFTVSYPLAFTMLALFSYYFPDRTVASHHIHRVKKFLITFAFLWAAGLFAVVCLRIWQPSLRSFLTFHYFYRLFRVFLLILVVASLINMFLNTQRRQDRVSLLKFYWIAGGIILGGFPFVFLWNLPLILNHQPLAPEWLTNIALIIVPVSVAIAIVKYRLFDIEFFLSRSIAYTGTITMMIVLYTVLVGSFSYLLTKKMTLQSPYLAAVAAVIPALLFAPMKTRIQQIVDRNFFRIRYNQFYALQNFLNRLNNCSSIDQVLRQLRLSLEQIMPLTSIEFVHGRTHKKIPSAGEEQAEQKLPNWLPLQPEPDDIQIFINQKTLARFESADNQRRLHFPEKYALIIRLGANRFWLLGKKKADDRFYREDLQLIEELARAARLAIQKLQFLQQAVQETAEKEKAYQLSRWKSLLVSEVAHNFRSPLNAMIWKLQTLRSKAATDANLFNQKTQELQQQIERLQNMVHSLLNLATIETGQLTVSYRSVPVVRIVEKMLASLQILFAEKSIRLKTEGSATLRFLIDEILFQEILQNVLENALKHAPADSEITITWKSVTENGPRRIRLSICDQGPGIPQQEQAMLFSPFSDEDHRTTRRSGFHLGLYIARQFVQAMKGDIQIYPGKNGGTCVTLFFQPGAPAKPETSGES